MSHPARAKFLLFAILVLGTAGGTFAADGDLDLSFDSDGIVTTDNGQISEGASDLVVQPDGKIIVMGQGLDNGQTNRRAVIVRYNPNGSIDTNFGTNGRVALTAEFQGGLALQPDGKILFVALIENSEASDFYIARLNSDGSFDTTFNTTGVVTVDLRGTADTARAVKIQPDGKIVVGGTSGRPSPATGFDQAIVRLNPDGSLDTTFDGDGKAFEPPSTDRRDGLSDIAIQRDGKIVTAGISTTLDSSTYTFLVVRFNADGSLDTTFDGDGKVFTQVATAFARVGSIAVQCDGKIVIAGTPVVNSFPKAALVRYNHDGSLDSTFADGGIMLNPFESRAFDLMFQADNKIVIVGSRGTIKMSFLSVARFHPNGSPDLSFSDDGWNSIPGEFLTFSEASAVGIQSDGKIVTGGGTSQGSNGSDFILVRWNASSGPANCSDKVADFDGDGKTDLSVFRDGTWYINPSGANNPNSFYGVQFGLATDKLAPADFDGDGRTDIAVFRDGTWYWLASSNSGFNSYQFGVASDIPVPADYTGDGRAELAVFRGGIWYTLNLSNNQFQAFQFGISTDKPVQADYDGDGKTDVAVYRDGDWYNYQSSDNSFHAVQFGIASDRPVASDYDGDGRADQAVYRSGVWYILKSTQGFYAEQFGISSDVPVAADYDGDGKTDVAVFRDGDWYQIRSQQGFGAAQFGLANDRPVPAAYVP